MVNPNDVRVIKTCQHIQTAFRYLLEQYDYEAITVQRILDVAKINRTTFYKHYHNKNELAKQLIEEFKQRLFIPILDKRFSCNVGEFEEYIATVLLPLKEEVRLLWKIETPKLHLKQDMYLMIKDRYISEFHQQGLHEVNLEFQGHMFASLVLAAMSYVLIHDGINPKELRVNMQMMFHTMII